MIRLSFSIRDYHDEVDCDIALMQPCMPLAPRGRPWQFEYLMSMPHIFGRSDKHAFIRKQRKVVLVPLSLEDMHAYKIARQKREESEQTELSELQVNSERELLNKCELTISLHQHKLLN